MAAAALIYIALCKNLKTMLYYRSDKTGKIKQSCYISGSLIHYKAGDIRDVFPGINEKPQAVSTAGDMAGIISEYKQLGYKLRNYSEPVKDRNRAAEKQNAGGLYSFGAILPNPEKKRKGRPANYGKMIQW